MTNYHVNTAGDVAVCRARTNANCPFGPALHSEDKAVAEAIASQYIENRVEMESFPRHWDPEFVKKQAAIYWVEDQALGSGNNPHRDWDYNGADERRFKDYLAGYQEALGHSADDEPEIEREASERKKQQPGIEGVFDPTAFKLGYARSLRAQREQEDGASSWLRKGIADYGVDHYKGAGTKYDGVRFVHNSFKVGERVLLSPGDDYTMTENGKLASKKVEKPFWATVDYVNNSHVSGGVGRVVLHPATITFTPVGGGSPRNARVTPEMLSANGHETFEAPAVNADVYLTPIYDDIRQWEKLPKTWTTGRLS